MSRRKDRIETSSRARAAVVTGGSSGNGRAIAIRLAEEGATAVVVADIREKPREGGEATVPLVEKEGARSTFVSCDVSRPDDAEEEARPGGSGRPPARQGHGA